tara:strand:+ start:7241 stop:13186 length:5946 start_codon:yes stop_codon:yes gene_type:complete
MPTPWEKYQQRRNNPYRGGSGFKGRALAQAKINEYQYPYEMGSVTSVEVDPEIEEQKRREAAEAQKQKMRGILSGPAALFPNLQDLKTGEGLKLGVDETALPKREQEISGKQNPFKWALSKTVAPTLEKWQELTEATAGLVATPFSSELQSLKNQGVSAGDRWRAIDLPTARIGKPKGEGFGFDVGVKGAVELVVDPVGWATTVMPIGLAFRAASYPARKLGAVAGKLTGVTKLSESGKKIYAQAVRQADDVIKAEMDNVSQDIFTELYERNVLNGPTKNGGLGKIDEARVMSEPNPDLNILMNYDEIMSSKDQIGYVDGLLAYINDRATAAEKRRSGTFFRAMNNAVQKFRPSVAKRMSAEGRIETYYNQYITAIPTAARLAKSELENIDHVDLFDLKRKSLSAKVKADLPEGVKPLEFQINEQAFITPKINTETVAFADDGNATNLIKGIKALTDDAIDTKRLRVSVNTDTNTVSLATEQGFSLGTLRLTINPTSGTGKIPIKGDAKTLTSVRKEIEESLQTMNKRADAFGGDEAQKRYAIQDDGHFEAFNSASYTFEPETTNVWQLPKIFGKKEVERLQRFREDEQIATSLGTLGGKLRKEIASDIEPIINRIGLINKQVAQTGNQQAQFVRETASIVQDANRIYKNGINRYFAETQNFINNANKVDDLKGLSFTFRSLAQQGDEVVPKLPQNLAQAKSELSDSLYNLKKNFIEIKDFVTADEALIALRNLDDGLRNGQLRANVVNRAGGGLDEFLGERELNGVVRQIMRSYAQKNQNLDFLIENGTNVLRKKSDAFTPKLVYRDLEKLFGKGANRIGTTGAKAPAGQIIRDLRNEFKKLYGLSIEDTASVQKEMPFLQFLDMAGTVVGHSHSTGRPIRLYTTGYFELTNKQASYLDKFYEVMDRGGQLVREEGALGAFDDVVQMKTSNYVHHLVESRNQIMNEYQVMEEIMQNGATISPKLGKELFQNTRSFTDVITEGIEAQGIKYADNPADIAEAFHKQVQESIANEHLKNKIRVVAAREIDSVAIQKRILNTFTSSRIIGQGLTGFSINNARAFTETYKKNYLNNKNNQLFIKKNYPEFAKTLDELADIDNLDATTIDVLVKRNTTGDVVKRFLDDVAEKERYQQKYVDNINLTLKQTKFTVPEVFGKGIFARERVATQERLLRRYNGTKSGANIYGLEDILFDDKLATNIENALGISEPGTFAKFADATSNVTDKIRVLQTAIDLGTPFLQGLPTLVTRPTLWGKATIEMYKTVLFPRTGGAVQRTAFYREKRDVIRKMNRLGINMSGTGNDYFRALDNGGSVGDYIKGKGFSDDNVFVKTGVVADKTIGRFQDGFEHFGDMLRVGLFEAHERDVVKGLSADALRTYERTGQVQDDAVRKNLDDLGQYVNQMTGAFSHTQNMISRQQANIERTFLFFSPSYTRASMGLVGSVLSGGLKGEAAHTALRNMLAAGVGMHVGVAAAQAQAQGKPIEEFLNLDPSSSSFLTTDVGGVKVGYGSFWNSSFKLFARILEDPSFRGDVLDSPLLMTGAGRGQAGFDESGIKSKIANNPVVQWLRGRSSPAGSQFWNLGMGSNYLGEELSPVSIDAAQEIGSNLFPFWAQNFFDSGFTNGATSAPFEFFGFRTYEIPPWERRDAIRDEIAMLRHDTLWRDLNDLQKKLILDDKGNKNVQRLIELDEEIKEKRRVVGGGELDNQIDDYYADIERAQQYYESETKKLLHLLHNRVSDENGVVIQTPADVIRNEKRIRNEKNTAIELLDDPIANPQYQNVKAYFESFNNFDKTERPEDYFAEKYADIYFSPEWENFNFYDFKARDEAIADLKNRWGGDGEQLEQYAKNLLFGRKLQVDPLISEYYIGVNKYFDLYYKGAHDAIFTNKYRGEFDELYERFRKAGVRDQELILEKNKRFRKALNSEVGAVRESMRKIDPALDAFLYRFRVGGITKPMHQFNLDRVDELNQLGHMDEYVPQWRVAGQ